MMNDHPKILPDFWQVERSFWEQSDIKWIDPKKEQPPYDSQFWVFAYGSDRCWGFDHTICLFYRDKEGEYWDMVGENHGSDMNFSAYNGDHIAGWLPYATIPIPGKDE